MTSTADLGHVVVIGPDKAGTTWIHEWFAARDDVAHGRSKELFFFDGPSWHRGPDWYFAQFVASPSSAIRAEVCHEYLFSPEAPERMAQLVPHSQVFFVVRDPVQRALSSYRYMQMQGRVRSDVSFGEALRTVDELVDHARYATLVRRFLDHFPIRQVQPLDFDLLVSSPDAFAADLTERIGLPPVELPSSLQRPVNAASSARNPAVVAALRRFGGDLRERGLHEFVSRVKSNPIVRRGLFRRRATAGPESVEPADREYVISRLAPELVELDEIYGTDYSQRWSWTAPCR